MAERFAAACKGSYDANCRCFDCLEKRRVGRALRRLARRENMHIDTGLLCDGCRSRVAERIKRGPLTNVQRIVQTVAGRFTA